MHKIKLLTCFVFLCLAASAQKKNNVADSYKKYEKEHSADNLKGFFNSFPGTFADFQKLYGYDDVKGASPYYEVANAHIALFFKAASIVDKQLFSQKVLQLSINGKWDADGVGYFQNNLRAYFFTQSKQMLGLLNNKSKPDLFSFWYFFSDGPHFDEAVHKKALNLLQHNSILLNTYLSVVKQVKKDNKH